MEEIDKYPNNQVTGSFIRQYLPCPSKDDLDRHFAFDKCQQVMKPKLGLKFVGYLQHRLVPRVTGAKLSFALAARLYQGISQKYTAPGNLCGPWCHRNCLPQPKEWLHWQEPFALRHRDIMHVRHIRNILLGLFFVFLFGLVWGLLWVLSDKILVQFFFPSGHNFDCQKQKNQVWQTDGYTEKITTECDKATADLMAWVQEVWLQWQPTAGVFLYNLQQCIQNRPLLLLDWWPPQSRSGKGQRQLQTHAASRVDSREFPIFSLGVASLQRSQTLKDKL